MAEQETIEAVLPDPLPIFPLEGALLLPGGVLPLNIFEPRYLDMVRDALVSHETIGMIQPLAGQMGENEPRLYEIGCAGRIAEHADTPDGRILMRLEGICRFRVAEELPATTLYRQVRPDTASFAPDLGGLDDEGQERADRQLLRAALERLLDAREVTFDWARIEKLGARGLVNLLVTLLPLEPAEKQALLEADDWHARAEVMATLIDMMVRGQDMNANGRPQ